jgi:hypothetical protein
LAPNSSDHNQWSGKMGAHGVRGQSRNIHSLGNTATLASPRLSSNDGLAFLFNGCLEDDAEVCEPRDSCYDNILAFPAGPEEGLEDASDRFALRLSIPGVA